MTAKIQNIYVPFNEDGSMQSFTWHKLTPEQQFECSRLGYLDIRRGKSCFITRFKPNYTFDATMAFEDFSRGKSSVKAIFKSVIDPKTKYEMFVADLAEILKLGKSVDVLSGTFAFCKRGLNYGVKWVGESEVTDNAN